MPCSRKRKLNDFKNKIKKKMKKIKQMMDDFSSSDSDSDSPGGVTSVSDSEGSLQAEVNPVEPEIPSQLANDDTMEEILGSNPLNKNVEGPELAPDLASRWESYLSSGIEKESRKKLIEKYNPPSNCKYLKAPTLNPEVEVLLATADNKKDKFLKNLQELMGKGITAGGEALTKLLTQRDIADTATGATQALVDSGKLLTDIFHTVSNHRKYQLYKYFSDSVQKIATQQKIDTSLFGTDFAEKCKLAKSVEATAKELQKPGTSKEPQKFARNLNYQRPPFKKMKIIEKRGGERYPDNRQRQKTTRGRDYRKATDYKYGKSNRH
ncbi:hypothetical protein NQ317_003085 [Molorchus minor]|uniref:Uncharacterized protein n=1 Tax=Molorchus minor TaxID=1323400 RepID=A0ABQ9J7S6_9CUCU|nr:hypothetical protein NQ317_003085 [Molorchus minor]